MTEQDPLYTQFFNAMAGSTEARYKNARQQLRALKLKDDAAITPELIAKVEKTATAAFEMFCRSVGEDPAVFIENELGDFFTNMRASFSTWCREQQQPVSSVPAQSPVPHTPTNQIASRRTNNINNNNNNNKTNAAAAAAASSSLPASAVRDDAARVLPTPPVVAGAGDVTPGNLPDSVDEFLRITEAELDAEAALQNSDARSGRDTATNHGTKINVVKNAVAAADRVAAAAEFGAADQEGSRAASAAGPQQQELQPHFFPAGPGEYSFDVSCNGANGNCTRRCTQAVTPDAVEGMSEEQCHKYMIHAGFVPNVYRDTDEGYVMMRFPLFCDKCGESHKKWKLVPLKKNKKKKKKQGDDDDESSSSDEEDDDEDGAAEQKALWQRSLKCCNHKGACSSKAKQLGVLAPFLSAQVTARRKVKGKVDAAAPAVLDANHALLESNGTVQGADHGPKLAAAVADARKKSRADAIHEGAGPRALLRMLVHMAAPATPSLMSCHFPGTKTKKSKTVVKELWDKLTSAFFAVQHKYISKDGVDVLVVDEFKTGRCKYNRGEAAATTDVWFLVIVRCRRDPETSELRRIDQHIVILPDRTTDTLLQIVTRYMDLGRGKTLITDSAAFYRSMSALTGWIHMTVNHSIEFTNSLTGASSNMAEGAISYIRRMGRVLNGFGRNHRVHQLRMTLPALFWGRRDLAGRFHAVVKILQEAGDRGVLAPEEVIKRAETDDSFLAAIPRRRSEMPFADANDTRHPRVDHLGLLPWLPEPMVMQFNVEFIVDHHASSIADYLLKKFIGNQVTPLNYIYVRIDNPELRRAVHVRLRKMEYSGKEPQLRGVTVALRCGNLVLPVMYIVRQDFLQSTGRQMPTAAASNADKSGVEATHPLRATLQKIHESESDSLAEEMVAELAADKDNMTAAEQTALLARIKKDLANTMPLSEFGTRRVERAFDDELKRTSTAKKSNNKAAAVPAAAPVPKPAAKKKSNNKKKKAINVDADDGDSGPELTSDEDDMSDEEEEEDALAAPAVVGNGTGTTRREPLYLINPAEVKRCLNVHSLLFNDATRNCMRVRNSKSAVVLAGAPGNVGAVSSPSGLARTNSLSFQHHGVALNSKGETHQQEKQRCFEDNLFSERPAAPAEAPKRRGRPPSKKNANKQNQEQQQPAPAAQVTHDGFSREDIELALQQSRQGQHNNNLMSLGGGDCSSSSSNNNNNNNLMGFGDDDEDDYDDPFAPRETRKRQHRAFLEKIGMEQQNPLAGMAPEFLVATFAQKPVASNTADAAMGHFGHPTSEPTCIALEKHSPPPLERLPGVLAFVPDIVQTRDETEQHAGYTEDVFFRMLKDKEFDADRALRATAFSIINHLGLAGRVCAIDIELANRWALNQAVRDDAEVVLPSPYVITGTTSARAEQFDEVVGVQTAVFENSSVAPATAFTFRLSRSKRVAWLYFVAPKDVNVHYTSTSGAAADALCKELVRLLAPTDVDSISRACSFMTSTRATSTSNADEFEQAHSDMIYLLVRRFLADNKDDEVIRDCLQQTKERRLMLRGVCSIVRFGDLTKMVFQSKKAVEIKDDWLENDPKKAAEVEDGVEQLDTWFSRILCFALLPTVVLQSRGQQLQQQHQQEIARRQAKARAEFVE